MVIIEIQRREDKGEARKQSESEREREREREREERDEREERERVGDRATIRGDKRDTGAIRNMPFTKR